MCRCTLGWALMAVVGIFADFVVAQRICAVTVGVLCDYNNNGVCDAADYVVWRDMLGTSGPLANEGVSLGSVDVADYNFWRERFGNTAGSGAMQSASSFAAGTTPEPSSGLLAVLAIAFSASSRRVRLSCPLG
jgi:hypothetical protein